MANKKIKVEGNVGMACHNPSENLIFSNGYIGIGTPQYPTELDIKSQQLIPTVFCEHGAQNEILKLCTNGDIFVKGKLIENDIEVVDALREFLKHHEFLK